MNITAESAHHKRMYGRVSNPPQRVRVFFTKKSQKIRKNFAPNSMNFFVLLYSVITLHPVRLVMHPHGEYMPIKHCIRFVLAFIFFHSATLNAGYAAFTSTQNFLPHHTTPIINIIGIACMNHAPVTLHTDACNRTAKLFLRTVHHTQTLGIATQSMGTLRDYALLVSHIVRSHCTSHTPAKNMQCIQHDACNDAGTAYTTHREAYVLHKEKMPVQRSRLTNHTFPHKQYTKNINQELLKISQQYSRGRLRILHRIRNNVSGNDDPESSTLLNNVQ